MNPNNSEYKKIVMEALAAIPNPKWDRMVQRHELLKDGDLYYVYDELFKEDRGKAKTWQPVVIIYKQSGGGGVRQQITTGGSYYCVIRPNSKVALMDRIYRLWALVWYWLWEKENV